ncbi:MAG: amino acid adenylation domain-containing protein, partial [Acidobacteriota bacterium]
MQTKSFSKSSALFVFSTLVEILRIQAGENPNRIAFTFLADGETPTGQLSYRELENQSLAIAALLQNQFMPGERVLLLYPAGSEQEFIVAFLACLCSGTIAVPVYPPDPARLNRSLPRLIAILNDACPTIALTTSSVLSMIEYLFADDVQFRSIRWLATDGIDTAWAEDWQQPDIDSDTVAFIQYTSGSTATPKGVVLTHGNILSNERMIRRAFGITRDTIGLGWLPLYHDMGLIGTILQPLCVGFPCILMPPTAFLQRPFRWLQAISRYQVTVSGGPNFAYELCLRKINDAERATLDLSSWKLAFCGAEPVRSQTLQRFSEVFESCHFHSQALYPCYGLAEATLMVTGRLPWSPPFIETFKASALKQRQVEKTSYLDNDSESLVGCGKASQDHKVIIVEPASLTECPPEQIGEIWVSGPSIAYGYWNKPVETKQTFQAYLANTGEGPFLRTGDLGFFYNDELFIAGRIKDIIIIRGRNYYPQDIEWTVEHSHSSLRQGCCAAFSIDIRDQERLVVVAEVERSAKELDIENIVSTIRENIASDHELQVYAIVLIKAGTIPKTSSGKIQRHACQDGFLTQSLEILSTNIVEETVTTQFKTITRDLLLATAVTERLALLENYLRQQAASALKISVSKLDLQQPLSRLGFDSLTAIELKNQIEIDLRITVPLMNLLQSPSITELAIQLLNQLAITTFIPLSITQTQETIVEHTLSYGQQSLWFLNQLAPESAAYNVFFAVQIRSNLDVAALRQAFQMLVDRHTVLRTIYLIRDNRPVCQIQKTSQVDFVATDISTWSKDSLNNALVKEAHQPFNLAEGPLLRVRLFTRSAQQHILLLTLHHIAIDLWSLVVLIDELGMFYEKEKENVELLLPATVQYLDYVRWQADMLVSPLGTQLRNYWQKQLAGELPVLNLPTDRPRPSVQTYRGASYAFRLDSELTEQLKILAQVKHATLYMTLLAGFQVLLYRYTNQEDILLGSPSAGRNRGEWQEVIGYLVNPLVLRVNLAGNPLFKDLLDQVRTTVLAALEHQDYPFPLLVEELQPVRDASRAPLFHVMFVLEKPHKLVELSPFVLGEDGACANWAGLEIVSQAIDQRIAQFDLTLIMVEANNTLLASLQYNTDLFDDSTISRMARHFQALLAAIAANPAQGISALPLLSTVEQDQLLIRWNNTQADYPKQSCVHKLFEIVAERYDTVIAVAFAEAELTYYELNRRANQLAYYLCSYAAGPEMIIGICMERSIEMIVGILGILKAGSAYVPLDPTYPKERLAFILEDTQTSLLLTQNHLREVLPECEAQILCLDKCWPEIVQEKSENLVSNVAADNLAYIIYTSGSTGRPKGVAMNHRALINMLTWQGQSSTLGNRARTLQFASLNFDVSFQELFSTWYTGGTVVLIHEELRRDVLSLLHLLKSESIERLFLPLVVLKQLAEVAVTFNLFPDKLCEVITAGEQLQITEQIVDLFSRLNNCTLYNQYGPTESHAITALTLTGSPHNWPALPPIGRPIANTQVYILDPHLQPVPIGITGELYISGDCLERGYFRRPELTAERFIPNPFSNRLGERLYKTGDLVRYLPNSNIEFLGRSDQQIKLRGYRIELGEIEILLSQHIAVRECVVVIRDNLPGGKQLVAYIVVKQEIAFSLDELKAFLKKRLPEYMVPAIFVQLEALPFTSSGKIDRQALPAPEQIRHTLATEFFYPRNPVEEIIANIWSKVLGVTRIGIQDNFFELGGHSLLATQIISRLRNTFKIELPLQALFESPTVAGLAEQIDKLQSIWQGQLRSPIEPITRNGELSLSFAQQRLWFIDRLVPNSSAYNMPGAVRLIGMLDLIVLARSLNEIVRRHEILRTVFPESNGAPIQLINAAEILILPLIDLQLLTAQVGETETLRLAIAQAQQPFDLAQGPLLRVCLLQLDSREHVLLVTMHHIISDGWSLRIFIKELTTIYDAFWQDKPSTLPELTIQYADYAAWQRQWLQGEVLQAQLSYWQQQLGSNLTLLELPLDRPRPPVQSFHGAIYSLVLPASLYEQLKAISNQYGVTVFMTALALFQTLLYRYSGQDQITVGSPIANRNSTEIEGLMGFFVNMLVLRTDLSGNPSFPELLERVREVALGAYAHQDLPFEKLVEEIQPQRDISYTPLFQVMFELEHTPLPELVLPGLTLTQFEI